MRAVSRTRRWLFYFVLAVPAVFLPQHAYMGINRVRYNLGWLVSGMDLLICEFDDGQLLHFQPSPVLPPITLLWTCVAGLAWRTRQWALARSDGLGALVQAVLTSFYCALIFRFSYGVVQVVWNWQLHQMNWAALERALVFGRSGLPYLYVLGLAAIFTTLLCDARLRRPSQRYTHVAFALCFAAAFWHLSPYLNWQLDTFDELIRYAHKQLKRCSIE